MLVGVPREIKDKEFRVALTPAGARELLSDGNTVVVETGAGVGSGFSDSMYESGGAEIARSADEVWERAELVLKVKEPLESEYPLLRPEAVLFTYLHLAGIPGLAEALCESGVTALAYETVELDDGSLPLLTPMSEVAGRIAVQEAAHYLEKPYGGSGKLMGGIPGVEPATVVVIGAGAVGSHAASAALGLGAHVILMNRGVEKLRRFAASNPASGPTTLVASREAVARAVEIADVVIGGVLVAGEKAPYVVTHDMVATMRKGSVIVDVSVDQGGCVETTRPTSHSDPVYEVEGVIHYAVTNMPGAVPHTSTYALTNATLPYIRAVANLGVDEATARDPALGRGLNVRGGKVVNEVVARSL